MTSSSSQPAVEPKNTRRVLLVLFLAVVATVLGMIFFIRPRDIVVSDSPDGSQRIIVRERLRFVDRNFRVVLVNRATGTERVVYTSDDQSPTNSHERFVWSRDSSKVVLVGDRYFVVPESTLENGDVVFLLYDVTSDKLWCNEVHKRGFQRVSSQQLVDDFGEDLKWEDPNLQQ